MFIRDHRLKSYKQLFAAVVVVSVGIGTGNASVQPDLWLQPIDAANQLVYAGNFAQAERAYRTALSQALKADDTVQIGLIFQNLGWLDHRRGLIFEAERDYLKSLNSLNQVPNQNSELLVRAYASLSNVYMEVGRYSKAEALVHQVLDNHLAGAFLDVASLKNSLGVILVHKQQFAEAKQVFEQTAQLCLGSVGEEVQEIGAIALANLAGLQMKTGYSKEAVDLYKRAVATMALLQNPEPSTFCDAMVGYGIALRIIGAVDAAEGAYKNAIQFASAKLGPKNLVLGKVLESYAVLLKQTGRKRQARRVSDTVRKIRSDFDHENFSGQTVGVDELALGQ